MTPQEFVAEGWHSVDMRDLPPPSETVEFARDESVHRQPAWFGRWVDLSREFNVAGLWWRKL